jgi:hypothetical protein
MNMRKMVCGAVLAAGVMIATAVAASAENYRRDGWFWNYHDERWCLSENYSMAPDCAYRTLQDCNFSRNGTGGTCQVNPRHGDRVVPHRRKKMVR